MMFINIYYSNLSLLCTGDVLFFTSLTICCLLPGERELGDEFSGAVQRRLSAPYHLKAKGWIFHG